MRIATDENFDQRILDGLRARLADLDVIRIQDTEMIQSPDDELLAWLAEKDRVLLTHDVRTMPKFLYERVRAGLPSAGVVEVRKDTPVGRAIDELEVVLGAGTRDDFADHVIYIPLR